MTFLFVYYIANVQLPLTLGAGAGCLLFNQLETSTFPMIFYGLSISADFLHRYFRTSGGKPLVFVWLYRHLLLSSASFAKKGAFRISTVFGKWYVQVPGVV